MAAFTDNPDRLDKIVEDDGVPSESMYIWMMLVGNLLESGFTGTIVTAALTGGGVQGSMTFQNGVLIEQVQAT